MDVMKVMTASSIAPGMRTGTGMEGRMSAQRVTKGWLSGWGRWIPLVAVVLALAACVHEPPFPPEGPIVDDGGNGGGGGEEPEPIVCDPNTIFFEQQVLPLLISNCAVPGCHNQPTDDNDDIEITSYATLMASDIIRLNDPLDSDLWEAINETDPADVMPQPPQNPLTAEQKEIIRQWLLQGAQNNSCVPTTCDTLNVTYSGTIAPLVAQRCGGCHGGGSPQGGLDFGTWDDLHLVADDGRLAAAIQHLDGAVAMPPSGNMLPDCRIQQFLIWIADGAPNN